MSEKNENLRSNLANFIKKAKEDKIVSYEEINSILSDDFSVEKTEKLIKKLKIRAFLFTNIRNFVKIFND